jgi:hypothetical protein
MWIRTDYQSILNLDHIADINVHNGDLWCLNIVNGERELLAEYGNDSEAESALNRIHEWLDRGGIEMDNNLGIKRIYHVLDLRKGEDNQ